MNRAEPIATEPEDPIARRLARSGIRLGEDDLRFLGRARATLDRARAAVTAAACEIRVGNQRPWPLPRRSA